MMKRPKMLDQRKGSGGFVNEGMAKAICTNGKRIVRMIQSKAALPCLITSTMKKLYMQLKKIYPTVGSHAPSHWSQCDPAGAPHLLSASTQQVPRTASPIAS